MLNYCYELFSYIVVFLRLLYEMGKYFSIQYVIEIYKEPRRLTSIAASNATYLN
jgi:hypothetical protein